MSNFLNTNYYSNIVNYFYLLINDKIKYMHINEKINKLSSGFILYKILFSLFYSLAFYNFYLEKLEYGLVKHPGVQ